MPPTITMTTPTSLETVTIFWKYFDILRFLMRKSPSYLDHCCSLRRGHVDGSRQDWGEIYNFLTWWKISIFTHQSYSQDLLSPDQGEPAGLESLVNVRVDQQNVLATHHCQEGTAGLRKVKSVLVTQLFVWFSSHLVGPRTTALSQLNMKETKSPKPALR